jgi:hypothetical protein
MERLLVPLNWVIGTVALCIGLAWPYYVKISVHAIQNEAEGTIQLLANGERQLQDMQHPFETFSNSALPAELSKQVSIPKGGRFEYEAFINTKGILVLRAYSKTNGIRQGKVPPGIYELRMDKAGMMGKPTWIGFSSNRSLY